MKFPLEQAGILQMAGAMTIGLGLLATCSASARAASMFDAVYISSDDALTPDYANNQVNSTGAGTYLAPISRFGAGDLDPDGDHIANRVATDGLNALPTDLLHNTNLSIAPNPGGGGAGGESIDYEYGKSGTTLSVNGQGSAVSHADFNAIDNAAPGGRRRLVVDFGARGANYYGDQKYPAIDRIGWRFLTGDTDMETAPAALTATLLSGGASNAVPTRSGTSGDFSWSGRQGKDNETTISNTVSLGTSPAFDQQWRVIGLGFVAGRLYGDLTAVFTLSDGSQTTILLGSDSQANPAETTTGELAGGEAFVGLDIGGLSGNRSITGVTFSTSRSAGSTGLFVDDLTVILSPVPEPGAMGWLLAGAAWLAMGRSRARSRA